MNEVMDALVNRRSVRKYKAEAVPEELVKEIGNRGSWAVCAKRHGIPEAGDSGGHGQRNA